MTSVIFRTALLTSTSFAFLLSTAAVAQDAISPPAPAGTQASETAPPTEADLPDEEMDEEEGEEIIVTGTRPRGSVIGDIPPENTLDGRDVRATGATDITELLDALAPQIGSARGRGGERPILLLNGRRISASVSFATFQPRRSSGLKSCPKRSRSNMAIAPTNGS